MQRRFEHPSPALALLLALLAATRCAQPAVAGLAGRSVRKPHRTLPVAWPCDLLNVQAVVCALGACAGRVMTAHLPVGMVAMLRSYHMNNAPSASPSQSPGQQQQPASNVADVRVPQYRVIRLAVA